MSRAPARLARRQTKPVTTYARGRRDEARDEVCHRPAAGSDATAALRTSPHLSVPLMTRTVTT